MYIVAVCVMWQIMENTLRCVAVSEPLSLDFVSTKYRKFGDSRELRQLACDVIRWECRPYHTIQPPPLGYFLKLRAPSIVALPMFRQSQYSHVCMQWCYVSRQCLVSKQSWDTFWMSRSWSWSWLIIIIIIQHLYSALGSYWDTEALSWAV